MSSGLCASFVGMSQANPLQQRSVAAVNPSSSTRSSPWSFGGVLLTGGYARWSASSLGTLTFSIVNQGIFYTGFDANWASLIIGILLLLAVS